VIVDIVNPFNDIFEEAPQAFVNCILTGSDVDTEMLVHIMNDIRHNCVDVVPNFRHFINGVLNELVLDSSLLGFVVVFLRKLDKLRSSRLFVWTL